MICISMLSFDKFGEWAQNLMSVWYTGPEEDSPKSLNFLDFVCHSPRSKNFQASYFHNFEQAELWGQTS